MARKSKLTPELQSQLDALLSNNIPVKTACEAVGIGERTFHRWMEEGEKATSGPKRQFWQACVRARGLGKSALIRDIIAAGTQGPKKDWRALAWLLERLDPDTYHLNKREISGPDGGPIKTEGPAPVINVVIEGEAAEPAPVEDEREDRDRAVHAAS